MSASPPLQVLLFVHPEDQDARRYEQALLRAFQGGTQAGGYLATGEDLGVQLQCFAAVPQPETEPSVLLDRFRHTLVVVLVDNRLADKDNAALLAWLALGFEHVVASRGRHSFLALALDERVGERFSSSHSALSRLELLHARDLGETAVRAAMFSLRALHAARMALASGLEQAAQQLRIFISHAKIDGLPLAHALKYQIAALPWLKKFYDVEDLPPGCDWQLELEKGVGSSLVVMLRTDVYDSRFWCRQEVLWADEYAVPAVLVDARTELSLPAGVLPFERVPVVRIPDGNLLRILFVALRESLRFAHFQRRVNAMRGVEIRAGTALRAFSYAPGMAALLKACRSIAAESAGGEGLILYPDPPLRYGMHEAAEALVEKYAPGTRLSTPQTLAVGT